MVPSTLSKASLTIPITKVASISYVRWTRDSIKPILSVSSGISRRYIRKGVTRHRATYSGPGQRSLPRYLVQCPDLPETKNIDFIRRGYRPPLQHRKIHAGRDDSPRRPGYGERSIRRLRQLPHDPIEEHLPWPLPRLWRTDTERGLPRRQHLLLPALPARKISNTLKLTIWQYVIWNPGESFFRAKIHAVTKYEKKYQQSIVL